MDLLPTGKQIYNILFSFSAKNLIEFNFDIISYYNNILITPITTHKYLLISVDGVIIPRIIAPLQLHQLPLTRIALLC